MAQLNITIEDSRKQEWKEAAAERDRSLTSLIKTAVEAEIQGGHAHGQEGDSSEQIAEITQAIQSIERGVSENTRRLSGLEDQMAEDPGVRDLADEIFELLPTEGQLSDSPYKDRDFGHQFKDLGIVETGRPEHFAGVTGDSKTRVLKAINLLRDETRLVGEVEHDGHTCYFKEA